MAQLREFIPGWKKRIFEFSRRPKLFLFLDLRLEIDKRFEVSWLSGRGFELVDYLNSFGSRSFLKALFVPSDSALYGWSSKFWWRWIWYPLSLFQSFLFFNSGFSAFSFFLEGHSHILKFSFLLIKKKNNSCSFSFFFLLINLLLLIIFWVASEIVKLCEWLWANFLWRG